MNIIKIIDIEYLCMVYLKCVNFPHVLFICALTTVLRNAESFEVVAMATEMGLNKIAEVDNICIRYLYSACWQHC